MHEKEKL